MVEDNEIKAVTSPFAIREGEIKVFDTKTNQLMKAIHVGKEPTTIVCL